MAEGMRNGDRSNAVGNEPGYIIDGDPGRYGGGTYTAMANSRMDPTIQDYENVFGPAARDVKLDLQRNKRHARWHLPDALKGANPWLTDKIDGLITDTTSSPFTTKLLPYLYIENVDAKIKWNRWTFQEGLASRVPYESAARTLTQSKQSYSGYTVRQGLAITMEHNFMMSEKGRENFRHQLQQVVGSIQYTNDIDVHVALITAPSYAKERAERYFTSNKTDHQVIREYIDLFGFMQKNPNAMDIIIEEGKSVLRSWGAAEPDFMLTNSKLTFNMQMIPEKTSYLTQGPDGVKKLREGPNISTYRGLSIIYSRAFSMEDGAEPRDVMRRRVRVAEYYRIPWEQGIENKRFSFYDESKDAWVQFTWKQLYEMSRLPTDDINITAEVAAAAQTELVIVRPNIEVWYDMIVFQVFRLVSLPRINRNASPTNYHILCMHDVRVHFVYMMHHTFVCISTMMSSTICSASSSEREAWRISAARCGVRRSFRCMTTPCTGSGACRTSTLSVPSSLTTRT